MCLLLHTDLPFFDWKWKTEDRREQNGLLIKYCRNSICVLLFFFALNSAKPLHKGGMKFRTDHMCKSACAVSAVRVSNGLWCDCGRESRLPSTHRGETLMAAGDESWWRNSPRSRREAWQRSHLHFYTGTSRDNACYLSSNHGNTIPEG